MATTEKSLITADVFMRMDLGEGTFELVRGEIVEVSPPMPEHGITCGNVALPLLLHGRRTGLGYVLTNDSAVLTEQGPDTVRGPDLCFYSQARWPRSEVGTKVPPVPPDLAVEVVSPGNSAREIQRKVDEYLAAGVLMVWVVHPRQRTVVIHRPAEVEPLSLDESDTIADLPELPGFTCRVAEFFL